MAGILCRGEQAILLHRGERSSVAVVHGNIVKPISVSPNGRQLILLSLHHSDESHRVYPQQRCRGSFACCSFSSSSPGGWLEVGDKDKIENRTSAFYKSEEYDIIEAKLDSLPSPDETNEAILVERDIPWWQSFPKRWVIVLLCFAAFLLCNMDRVSNSLINYSTTIHFYMLAD